MEGMARLFLLSLSFGSWVVWGLCGDWPELLCAAHLGIQMMVGSTSFAVRVTGDKEQGCFVHRSRQGTHLRRLDPALSPLYLPISSVLSLRFVTTKAILPLAQPFPQENSIQILLDPEHWSTNLPSQRLEGGGRFGYVMSLRSA